VRFVDRDGMTLLAQEIGRGQTARTAADHRDALARQFRRFGRLKLVLDRPVADILLDAVDADEIVDLIAVAAVFARGRADASHRGREGISLHHAREGIFLPGHARHGRLVHAARDGQPSANVMARRAAALTGGRAMDIGRTFVALVLLEDLFGQILGIRRRLTVLESTEGKTFGRSCFVHGLFSLFARDGGFAPLIFFSLSRTGQQDRVRHHLMHTDDGFAVEAVLRQDLRELRFADRADGGHVRHAMLVGNLLQRAHAREGALGAYVHDVVAQQAAAAAATEGLLADRLWRHVEIMIADGAQHRARQFELPAWFVAHARGAGDIAGIMEGQAEFVILRLVEFQLALLDQVMREFDY